MSSAATRADSHLTRITAAILDAVLPPQCPSCGAIVTHVGTLCTPCWTALSFIEDPMCRVCGLPFPCTTDPESLCAACARKAPPWDRARSVLVYDDASRRLILSFKNGDRTEAAPLFARWMIRAAGPLLDDGPLLVPVPLHWTRLFTRRYNQAALLAHAIGRSANLAVVPDLLVRRKRTHRLGKLGAVARAAVVKDAIMVKPARLERARGRRVVLIDDVLTTGSTTSACCRALAAAGITACDVLTLARALRS